MSIPTEVVALEFADIVADVVIDVDFPLFAADEAVVLYGHDVLVAVLDTDYTVTLNPDDDYVDFQITPLAAFITKINDLIAADATEENKITITRILPLTTDITPTLAQFRANVATSVDRIVMMLQQQARSSALAIRAPANEVGGPSLAIPGVAQRASLSLEFDATGKPVVGPTAAGAIAGAEAAQAAAEAAQALAETAEANAAGQAAAAGVHATSAQASAFAAGDAQTAAELAETNAETAQAAAETAETNAEAAAAAAVGVGNGVLTTEGDIVVADGAGDAARLAIGGAGDALTVVAGTPAWAPAPVTYDGGLAPHKTLRILYVSATTVTVTADEVVLFDAAGAAKKFGAINVTLDITVSGVGGLDTGAEASATWYYVHGLGHPDGSRSAVLSLSAATPTLSGGYTFWGLLGAVRNDGSGNVKKVLQWNNEAWCVRESVLTAGGATTYTAVDISDEVPPIARAVKLECQVKTTSGNAQIALFLSSGGTTTTPETDEAIPVLDLVGATADSNNSVAECPLKVAQSYEYYVSGPNPSTTHLVTGWKY